MTSTLLGVLDSAIYLLDGHAHFDTMDEVVNADLLSHLYGTSIQVVHTPQGDLYMREHLMTTHLGRRLPAELVGRS